MNLYTLLFAGAGLLTAFSFVRADLRKTLLGSDADGLQPFGLGIVLAILGVFVAMFDYTGGYLLKGLGLLFGLYGAFVLTPDGITDRILNPVTGVIYAIVAVFAFNNIPIAIALTVGHILTLAVPAGLAVFAATFVALSFTSESFKGRLSQETGGALTLIVGGIVAGVFGLFAGTVPLVILASALSGLLFALGVLVILDGNTVDRLLTVGNSKWYLIILVIALGIARLLF